MAEIEKHKRFYFLCLKPQNYQIYAVSRGKTYTNQNEILRKMKIIKENESILREDFL